MLTVVQGLGATVLAALLVVAGTIKLVRPGYAAGSLRRITPAARNADATRLRRAARGVGAVECLVGAALVLLPGWGSVAAAGLALVLFVAFAVVTRRAVRRGESCGCWGSLSDGPAGRGELARRYGFVAIAAGVLAVRVRVPGSGLAWWIGLAVLALSAAAGVHLAVDGRRSPAARVASLAAFGAAREVLVPAGRPARGWKRRRILSQVRHDPDVVAVATAFGGPDHFGWRQARVRVNSGTARTPGAQTIVGVACDGASMRVVLRDHRIFSAIGESADVIVFGKHGTASVIPKPRSTAG